MTRSITLKSDDRNFELSITDHDHAICIESISNKFTGHHRYIDLSIEDIKEIRDFLNIIINEKAATVQ